MTSYGICIQRESIYHVYTLLVPSIVLSILIVLMFLLPPECREKITLGNLYIINIKFLVEFYFIFFLLLLY